MSDYNEKDKIENCDENNNRSSNDGPVKDEMNAKKEPRRISLQSFVISTVALVLAAVMITYSLCSTMYKKAIDEAYFGKLHYGASDQYDKLDLVRAIFDRYSYLEINDEDQLDAVIRAYVRESGDRYAVYYNAEEYAEHLESVAGNSVGIGITVMSAVVTVDGTDYNVINVIDVVDGGPADLAGVKVGDKINWLGKTESDKMVGEMPNYNDAVNAFLGEVGTVVDFGVFREKDGGYEKIFFSVERKNVERPTVTYKVSETNSKVGVVRITQFNYTTPKQFTKALDDLLAKGCENIVFDVRGNPGGSLDSVVAVLSYMLPKTETLLSTIDADGTKETIKVFPVTNLEGEAANCNVADSEIGKYSGKVKKMAVLCDGNSASAAELFAANFRDHSLGILVGEKTYGKGSMQSVFSLASYGYAGGLRLTTRMYFPPCGESYDGIGIEPTENYNISLSEEAKEYLIEMLPESLDDQLLGAIRSFD